MKQTRKLLTKQPQVKVKYSEEVGPEQRAATTVSSQAHLLSTAPRSFTAIEFLIFAPHYTRGSAPGMLVVALSGPRAQKARQWQVQGLEPLSLASGSSEEPEMHPAWQRVLTHSEPPAGC